MGANDNDIDDNEIELWLEMKEKSDEELYEVVIKGTPDEKYVARVHLSNRGGRLTFEKTIEFIKSIDPDVRAEGALIMGQLGGCDRPFMKETTPLLMNLLMNDPEMEVRGSAAAALGHLGDSSAIPCLLNSVTDQNAVVRYHTAFALGCFNDIRVVDMLIQLSSDMDDGVRNWATFGVGSCIEFETQEIRDALFDRITETDPEIRGEAMIGLAKRKDKRVMGPLIQELSGEFHGGWCLEASELIADPSLYPYLEELRERIKDRVEDHFLKNLDKAITVCKPL